MKSENEKILLLREFVSIVKDISHSAEFSKMKKYKHHVNSTLYDHSVKVAFLCFLHHKRFGCKTDINELVRGALLHDYYLYDLHGGSNSPPFHWFKHPKVALRNALVKYPELTYTQRDMIIRHMFPLTPLPPRTRGGWLVCFYDKVAAISDRFDKRPHHPKNS